MGTTSNWDCTGIWGAGTFSDIFNTDPIHNDLGIHLGFIDKYDGYKYQFNAVDKTVNEIKDIMISLIIININNGKIMM